MLRFYQMSSSDERKHKHWCLGDDHACEMLAHEHKDLRMGPLHLSKNSGFPYGHACNSRTESTEESSKILKLTG